MEIHNFHRQPLFSEESPLETKVRFIYKFVERLEGILGKLLRELKTLEPEIISMMNNKEYFEEYFPTDVLIGANRRFVRLILESFWERNYYEEIKYFKEKNKK